MLKDIKLPLLSKAALLLDKDGPEWNEIKEYYKQRNKIAHGDLWTQTYAIQVVGLKMDSLVKKFSRK